MTWFHAFPWQWLESLAMVLFWTLVIVLALAPINYLRDQLNEQMQETDPPLRASACTARHKNFIRYMKQAVLRDIT